MTSFLSLPSEIRQIIYTHALAVGHICPYFETQKSEYPGYRGDFNLLQFGYGNHKVLYQPLDVHLLQSCHFVYQGASPFLDSRNTILPPILHLTMKIVEKSLATPERRSWVKPAGLMPRTGRHGYE